MKGFCPSCGLSVAVSPEREVRWRCPGCGSRFALKRKTDGSGWQAVIITGESSDAGHLEQLELPPDRRPSLEQLRRAYRRKVREYHPDRVATLGKELRDLAEAKTKALNEAFRKLKEKLERNEWIEERVADRVDVPSYRGPELRQQDSPSRPPRPHTSTDETEVGSSVAPPGRRSQLQIGGLLILVLLLVAVAAVDRPTHNSSSTLQDPDSSRDVSPQPPPQSHPNRSELDLSPAASPGPAPIVPVRSIVRAAPDGLIPATALYVVVRNQLHKPADLVRFEASLLDDFGEPVCRFGTTGASCVSVVRAEATDFGILRPGRRKRLGPFRAEGFRGVGDARVLITNVRFTDSTTWTGRADESSRIEEAPRLRQARRREVGSSAARRVTQPESQVVEQSRASRDAQTLRNAHEALDVGDLERAASLLEQLELTSPSSQHTGLRQLRILLMSRGANRVGILLQQGRCPDAQHLTRRLGEVGADRLARTHFAGDWCRAPSLPGQ